MYAWRQWLKRGTAGFVGLGLLTGATGVFAEPISLDQAVQTALKNNLDIQVDINSEKQAEYALQSTKGSQGLSIDASNTFYLRQIQRHAQTSTTGINFSLPLYTGGKNEGNIDMAKIDVTKAGLDVDKTKQDVRLKTVSAYYNVLEAQKTVAVDQEAVDNDAQHLENVQAQYSVGNVAKVDVLRSEVELSDAQQTLMKAQNACEVAMNNLKNLMRWKKDTSLELVDDFQYVPVSQTMDECVEMAKRNRPDLEKCRLAILEAAENVDVARADQKPSVSLTAGTSWGSSILPDEDDRNLQVGVTTSWNLFDSQATKAKVKKAESAVNSAQLELTSQEDTVELAVKEYYLSMKEAEKRMTTTQVAVQKAEEDYFIAEAKYQAGEGVMLDVIDAQLALTTAKNNYIEAQYDYATYKAELENAMGLN